jgi:hypothetical protein
MVGLYYMSTCSTSLFNVNNDAFLTSVVVFHINIFVFLEIKMIFV